MEPSSGRNRRLATVMFLDMVGYSALMSRSEPRALSDIKSLEKILRAEIPAAGGRLVKLLGDGSLAEFPTAGAAVSCSRRILSAISDRNAAAPAEDRFQVRIGLHLGEVCDEGGDIFGDAVNIAARVQPIADPGGIAMTGTVHAQVKNQEDLKGLFLPAKRLKNIPERMSIFLVPPPNTSFTWWALRRKGLPAAVLPVFLLCGAAGGWLAWRHFGEEPLRVVYILVESKDSDPAAVGMAHDLEDELMDLGARLRGVRWGSRRNILQLLYKRGITDPEKLLRAESGACLVARDLGLKLVIAGRLRRTGKGWRLETGITDVEDIVMVGSFSVEGKDVQSLTDATLSRLQDWIDSQARKEAG